MKGFEQVEREGVAGVRCGECGVVVGPTEIVPRRRPLREGQDCCRTCGRALPFDLLTVMVGRFRR